MPQPELPAITVLPEGLAPDVVAAWHPTYGLLLPTPRCADDDPSEIA